MKLQKREIYNGLRTRIFLAMTAIVVLALSSVTVVSTLLMRSTGETVTRYEVADMAEELREWATSLVVDERTILALPDSVAPERVLVLDSQLQPAYPFVGNSPLIDLLDDQVLQVVLQGHSATQTLQIDRLGGECILYTTLLRGMDYSAAGVIMLALPTNQAGVITRTTMRIMLIAVSVSLCLAVLASMLIAANLTGPLGDLQNAVRNFASGDYGARVPVRGHDEVSRVAAEFNRLAQQLTDTIDRHENEKQRLIQVIEGISEGIIAIDGDGNLIRINPAAYSLLRVRYGREKDLLAVLDAQNILQQMEMTAHSQTPRTLRYTVQGVEQEAIITCVNSLEGEQMGAVCLLRDISAAERMEKMRRDYVANISHEFRAPITGIRGFVEPLMDGLIDDPQERLECYRIIHSETLRLERLISETLELSHLQSRSRNIPLERMQIEDIVSAVCTRFRERAHSKQIDLRLQCAERIPAVLANGDRIDQLLVILLDNAIKFTPQGGTVTLAVDHTPNEVLLQVRDTGCGIPEEDLPYVFERFFKGDRSRSVGGTGLGLAIAREIAALLQGHIEVESTPGEGTLFTLFLPIDEPGGEI